MVLSLKERLKNGEIVIGTWCLIPSPHMTSILANAGLDFVIIDLEHGPIDLTKASEMVFAAGGSKCEALARISKNDPTFVQHALDMGCSGVVVPHVESVNERKAVVSYAKYSPDGIRGFSPFTKAGGYANAPVITKIQNERSLTVIMIEGREGLDNLENIIDDENVDVIYLGTYDLSVALGVPGDVKNSIVINAMEKAAKAIVSKGKVAGCMAHNLDDLKRFKQLGINFILYKVDTLMVTEAVKTALAEASKIR